jgi:hypothetical protein
MRSVIRIGLLGVILAAVVGAPVSAHPHRRTPPAPRIDAHAVAGRAAQGGELLVAVRVRLPRGTGRDAAPAAQAVVHLASGDVSVDLTGQTRALRGHRFGDRGGWHRGRVWRGVASVPVSATEQVGWVKVDVTVTLGDGSVTVGAWGRIHRSRTTPTPDPDPETPCTAGCQEL